MSSPSRKKVGCLISLLILMGVGVGFMLGIIVSKNIQTKKEEPAFWKQAAMKQLDKLHPSEAQREKFEVHTDTAVTELATLRDQGIKNVWEIINRATDAVQQELTPEQRPIFEKIRPKPPVSGSK